MKIQILSDLHLEFEKDGGESFVKSLPVTGDVLVLAGDIVVWESIEVARKIAALFCSRWKDVVYVPGNHEYYGSDTRINAADEGYPWKYEGPNNFYDINGGFKKIDDVSFVGATLWFPETPDEALYRDQLNDFHFIKNFMPWVYEEHDYHMNFLTLQVKKHRVIVTHHLPHPKSIAPKYAGSPLNRFFLAEDAAELVETRGAKLWIHGHTHEPCDYVVGNTRVVCNPRGYPGEHAHVDLGFTVEV